MVLAWALVMTSAFYTAAQIDSLFTVISLSVIGMRKDCIRRIDYATVS